MKLYLSSYKVGNQTEELKKWITENDNKICLIPNSRDIYPENERKALGIQNDVQELEELGFEVTVVSLKDYFDKKEQLREDLKQFHAFYVIGGNTFALRQAMYLSGFDEYLKEISKAPNYLYAGYSAGICVLYRDLYGIDIVDDPNLDPYNYGKIIWEGIGLIDYHPLPHYKSDHPESEMVEKELEYCQKNNIPYRTLHDGDVIIDEINIVMNKKGK